jgi:hypothetical protein
MKNLFQPLPKFQNKMPMDFGYDKEFCDIDCSIIPISNQMILLTIKSKKLIYNNNLKNHHSDVQIDAVKE